ncbi:MAG: ATP-dependent RNA helicase HrpA [Gammaproteobacteria bacterium]|nr:ATP-dependent RNA helicase HrpA [Gammaproteobacteria bacterium]MBQ0840196.1 ATP-dependent RNA helicase HrpA [Gammaproteobacteria bacterium]
MSRDRFRFSRQLKNIEQRSRQGKLVDHDLSRLTTEALASQALVEKRRQLVSPLSFPEELPVSARRDEISAAIAANQLVIIAGETGSGKTTQLPKICLELGRGVEGLIGHTQPRRIAARTVAQRIAEEVNTPLGEVVGYQVRFQDHSNDNTLVKLMTDGILLAETQRDRYLNRYDTLIIDEAHERSLNIDFLLGYLKQILPKRPDLKVIITSATIDVERFSKHFNDAPVIEVSGRTWPVDIHYRPLGEDEELASGIANTVEDLLALPKRGDVLVFLSGEREIREAAKELRQRDIPHLDVLPLYARLSLAEQTKVFKAHRGTRVVLATNVAETSLTVPGIRYVIDSGYARISRYSYRTKVQRLPIEAVSQASANQRSGRCGRVSEGVCVRLYSEQDYLQRPEFTDPEIVRTNLAAVILQMMRLGIGSVRDFPFIEPPDSRLINDGFLLLKELDAVDGQERLTASGKPLSQFPVDPRMGRMLLAAAGEGSLKEVLIIVAMLSIQDPRERPADKRQAADEKHRQWLDKDSDFISILNLWQHFEEQRQALTRNQFAKYCKKSFVSYLRMVEWRDLHHQLHTACRDLGLEYKKQPADNDSIHRALLSGLLSHIGFRHEGREYLGTRNRKFHVFPGSGLAKKPPKWVMAVELLETTRLFAHHCASFNEEWLPTLAAHLVKKSHSEAHYHAARGQVMAYEKQTLYGLTIVERQQVEFGKIDAKQSREVFIQSALVEGLYGNSRAGGRRGSSNKKVAFFAHNTAILKDLHELEDRLRRRDILADESALQVFYDEIVPAEVIGLASFERWRKGAEQSEPRLLYVSREQLTQNQPLESEEAQFPKTLSWADHDYQLHYLFEPGNEQDGVSVDLSVEHLNQVPRYRFDWLVPGLLREKCIALLKGLPKQWRKHFVPVPSFVDKVLPLLAPDNRPLHEGLATQLKRLNGVDVPLDCWAPDKLEAFYRMNFRLFDERGKVLESLRDLELLKAKYRDRVQATIRQGDNSAGLEKSGLTEWDFGELPALSIIKKDKHEIRAYPALNDDADSVSLRMYDTPELAENKTRAALVRLAILENATSTKYLRKALLKGQDLQLKAALLPDRKTLSEDIIFAAFSAACFAGQAIPRDQQSFATRVEQGKSNIVTIANELESLLLKQAASLKSLYALLGENEGRFPLVVNDVRAQLAALYSAGFVSQTALHWLRQYPRYAQAALVRLDKRIGDGERDAAAMAEIAGFWREWQALQAEAQEYPEEILNELQAFRHMIEEYRVSSFAQQLKTIAPVSGKRLQKQLAKIKAALHNS